MSHRYAGHSPAGVLHRGADGDELVLVRGHQVLIADLAEHVLAVRGVDVLCPGRASLSVTRRRAAPAAKCPPPACETAVRARTPAGNARPGEARTIATRLPAVDVAGVVDGVRVVARAGLALEADLKTV